MRPFAAFLFSLVTYFGGHIYNGRWTRAALFGALLLIVLAAGWLFAVYGLSVFVSLPSLDPYDLQEWGQRLRLWFAAMIASIAVLWLLSALTAALDARKQPADATTESRPARFLAALAMSGFGIMALGAFPFLWLMAVRVADTVKRQPSAATSAAFSPFSGSSTLLSGTSYLPSGVPSVVNEAPPLPPSASSDKSRYLGATLFSVGDSQRSQEQVEEGEGRIRGRVQLDNQPLAGLKLKLTVAPSSETQSAVSDGNGYYSISLPPGQYWISGWELDMDSANRVLLGKVEKEAAMHWTTTPSLTVATAVPTTGPDFVFVTPLSLIHPPEGAETTTDTLFEWKAYPGASYYQMYMLDAGTHPDGGASGMASRRLRLTGTTTTAAIAGFTLKSGHYYTWGLRAFDARGGCISQSPYIQEPFKVK